MRVQRAIQATRLLSQKERTFWDEDHQYCPMLTLMGVVATAALDWYYEYCIQGYLGERGRCDSSTEIYHAHDGAREMGHGRGSHGTGRKPGSFGRIQSRANRARALRTPSGTARHCVVNRPIGMRLSSKAMRLAGEKKRRRSPPADLRKRLLLNPVFFRRPKLRPPSSGAPRPL